MLMAPLVHMPLLVLLRAAHARGVVDESVRLDVCTGGVGICCCCSGGGGRAMRQNA